MTQRYGEDELTSEAGVRADLQRQPHLLLQLAENSLVVAESLRSNYLRNTASFISLLRKAMRAADQKRRSEPVLRRAVVPPAEWADVSGEVVTFIDGGVGSPTVANQSPILLRVGSYTVRTGERNLAAREQFGYYPVILGNLEGGSKERPNFPDVVRITAELLGGLSALVRTPDLGVLLFHGPLTPALGPYSGHIPFTEGDIDLFLHHYLPSSALAGELKRDFLREARVHIYPALTDRSQEWVEKRVFEPLSWIAYLCRRLVREAQRRDHVPVIAGVVERGRSREFSERVLLERIFHGLRMNERENYFNLMYGRTDLTSPKAFLDRLGYTDSILLSMLLRPGEYSEPWEMDKYLGLIEMPVPLPGEAGTSRVNFQALRSPGIGLPPVLGFYERISEGTEPVRVEVFADLGREQVPEAARRVGLYSRLLPGYGFPVGLDVADKYAQVPAWMTEAYSKMIGHHLGVSLQRGEVSDADLRDVIVRSMYMKRRDWLFRPRS
jgi:hypothetical protein